MEERGVMCHHLERCRCGGRMFRPLRSRGIEGKSVREGVSDTWRIVLLIAAVPLAVLCGPLAIVIAQVGRRCGVVARRKDVRW